MGDVMANFKVEQQRLKMQIMNQRANIERQKLEIMEMADRKARYEENIVASHKAIEKYEVDLASLEEEHGKLKDSDVESARESLDS